ncbi:MAG: DUF5615 family PIN-like protein [Phycisphaeraceae bacterium]|nr:DUF5615 family PIN-like protein [Phycisphaeraceae bacterium]
MKLLLDEGLPHPAADALRRLGFDAVHVRDVGLEASNDAQLVAAAASNQWVIVTLDSDFHAIVAVSGAGLPSVIRIRIEGLRWEPLAKLLARVIQDHRGAIEHGALVSIHQSHVRIRRLPIQP